MRTSTILFAILMVGILVFSFGCIPITQSGSDIRITNTENGLSGVKITDYRANEVLRAMVKGSIYSTGEQISLYGTCLDSNDRGFPNSYSTFAAWYPNGTLMFNGTAGQQIQQGYFVYIAPMSAVPGTYLTEFTCHVNGSDVEAKAFGEWQNPMWVARIGQTLTNTQDMQQQLLNYSNMTEAQLTAITNQVIAIMNQTNRLPGWFNQTWSMINSSNSNITVQMQNISAQLEYVAQVANSSVDRNDSYLARALQNLAANSQVPISGVLTVVEAHESIKYFKEWNIHAQVYNEYNKTMDDSKIECLITTTNDPATVLGEMSYHSAGKSSLLNDGKTGFWYWKEDKIRKLDTFDWTVNCTYLTH